MAERTSAADGASKQRPRWARWLLITGIALVAIVIAFLIAIRQPPIATRLTNAVLARVHPRPRASLVAGGVAGDWISRLELRHVRLTRGDTLLASVDTLRARYDLLPAFRGEIHVREVTILGLVTTPDFVDTTQTAPKQPGRPLTIADWLRGRFYPGPVLRVDHVAVRGARERSSAAGQRFGSVDLEARDLRLGHGFSFRIDSLATVVRPTPDAREAVALRLGAVLDDGRLEVRDLRLRSDSSAVDARVIVAADRRDSIAETRLVLHARPLRLRDLAAFLPGAQCEGSVRADLDLQGMRPGLMSGTLDLSSARARWGGQRVDGLRVAAKVANGRTDATIAGVYGRARAGVSGWARLFDPAPSYAIDVKTDRLPEIPGVPAWTPIARRARAAVTLHIEGTGFARPFANVRGDVRGGIGALTLDGWTDFSRSWAWGLRRLTLDDFDLGQLRDDSSSFPVTGRLSGSMRGPAIAATMHLETPAGVVDIDSLFGCWERSGALRLLGARFRDFDLEAITHQPALASRLTGTLDGQLRNVGVVTAKNGGAAALRDGRVTGDMQLDLGPSRFRDQSIPSGTIRATLARGAVNGQAQMQSASGRIDLTARARPFDAPPRVDLDRATFADLDLQPWTGVAGLRSRLTGSATGSAAGGTWQGVVHLDRSRFGDTPLEGGEARGSWSEGRVQLAADLRSGVNTLNARADIATGGPGPHGTAEAVIPFDLLAALAGRDSLRGTGGVTARMRFEGSAPNTMVGEGVLTGKGTVGRAHLDSLFAQFHLRDGTFTLDTLLARSNAGRAAGAGHLALFDTTGVRSSDLRARLLIDNAAPLAPLLGADTLSVDTATVEVSVRGGHGARALDLTGSIRSLVWNELRLARASGTVHADLDRAWRPLRSRLDVSLRRIRAGFAFEQADVHIDRDTVTTAFDLKTRRDPKHETHLAGHMLDDRLGRHLTLETFKIAGDSTTWALTRPARVDIASQRLAIQDFDLRSANGRVAAHGVIDRGGDQDFQLELKNVRLDAISAALARPNLTGAISGELSLSGPATAPHALTHLEADLLSEGHPAGSLRTALDWNASRMEIAGRLANPEGDSLAWAGSLPLALSLEVDSSRATAPVRVSEGNVDVRLLGKDFPLTSFSPLLDPEAVRVVAGTLDLDARLTGASGALVGNGRIDVSGGQVALRGLGVVYKNIELRGGFEKDRFVVQRAHLTSDKGSLDATGELRFLALNHVEPKLHVQSNKFAFISTEDLRAIVSGAVDLTGTLAMPVVRGSVTIENSTYTFAPAAAQEPGTGVVLTEADQRMLEEHFGEVTQRAPNLVLGLYDAADLDLAVGLRRNNWLRQRARPKLSVALTGDFTMKKPPHAEPLLVGRIEPVPGRGYVEQFARSFDITGGEVLLNGGVHDHRVDIQAEYRPPSASESDPYATVVRLDVNGTLDAMKLSLSSEPPMSEVDIINYIATGRSPTSSGSSASDQSLAKDIGVSALTGPAEEAAQQAVGLDVLQVRFDALQGATLVAGRYVDPQLYVGFRQPLQYNKDVSATNSNEVQQTSVEVEYAFYKWLILNLQAETANLRSFIRFRHAY